MDTFFKIIRTAVSILAALIVSWGAVMMLLGVALFIWVGVATIPKFIESNQNDDDVIKEDAPVIKMFIKKDGEFFPVQEYFSLMPKDLIDGPNDSAITKALKLGKREEYTNELNRLEGKEFILEFKYKDSYIEKAVKQDMNLYEVKLKIPALITYTGNGYSKIIEFEGGGGIDTYKSKGCTDIKLDMPEQDMYKMLKDGNLLSLYAEIDSHRYLHDPDNKDNPRIMRIKIIDIRSK